MKKLLCASAVLLASLAGPTRAAAFSDYELFGLPPLEGGGGGGRYFTTSPIDGFGCGVCHTGGIKPLVQIRGLPEKEYIPGAAYDVELLWANPQIPHSLNLEFVTATGQPAGQIVLPDVLEPQDRCAQAPNDPAALLIPEAAPRQVLWMNECGASRLRFRFIAPADTELTFATSIVRTDMSEKPEGDGVLEIRRVLHRQGFAPASAGCAVTRGTQREGNGAALLGVLALGLFLAVRARRRR